MIYLVNSHDPEAGHNRDIKASDNNVLNKLNTTENDGTRDLDMATKAPAMGVYSRSTAVNGAEASQDTEHTMVAKKKATKKANNSKPVKLGICQGSRCLGEKRGEQAIYAKKMCSPCYQSDRFHNLTPKKKVSIRPSKKATDDYLATLGTVISPIKRPLKVAEKYKMYIKAIAELHSSASDSILASIKFYHTVMKTSKDDLAIIAQEHKDPAKGVAEALKLYAEYIEDPTGKGKKNKSKKRS